jgi:hypothetical protein
MGVDSMPRLQSAGPTRQVADIADVVGVICTAARSAVRNRCGCARATPGRSSAAMIMGIVDLAAGRMARWISGNRRRAPAALRRLSDGAELHETSLASRPDVLTLQHCCVGLANRGGIEGFGQFSIGLPTRRPSAAARIRPSPMPLSPGPAVGMIGLWRPLPVSPAPCRSRLRSRIPFLIRSSDRCRSGRECPI